MSVQALTPQEIEGRGLSEANVWYVVNVTKNHISGFKPGKDGEEDNPFEMPWYDEGPRSTPVFFDEADAERCRFIVSKQAFIQNDRLEIESEPYADVVKRAGQWDVSIRAFDSDRAKIWFEKYADLTLTREWEESRHQLGPREDPYA